MGELTVLIVDDEGHILHSLKRLLRQEPYSLISAQGGESGLEVLKENEVHLVLSDQRMPGMTGIEFLQKVRELYPDIIRIVLSGYVDVSVMVDSINKGGVYRFMAKPWNDEELKTVIRQCLEHYNILCENRQLMMETSLQNEKLLELTDELEARVEERTRMLKLSQDVLAKLPVAVIGLSCEGEVILTNEAVSRTIPSLQNIMPGTNMTELFPENLLAFAKACLDGQPMPKALSFDWKKESFSARAHILGSQNERRGCILMLE